MINLDIHYTKNIEITHSTFKTFNVYTFTFIDDDGRKTTVKSFTQGDDIVEIQHLPEEDCRK
jgi:hypothetical protein